MNKLLSIIVLCLTFTSCTTYRALINPETSRDKYDGKVIAGNYWKDLQACNYIHKENTISLYLTLNISDKDTFVKKCMQDYGYAILR